MRLIGWNNPNLWIVNQSVVINRFRWRSSISHLYVLQKMKLDKSSVLAIYLGFVIICFSTGCQTTPPTQTTTTPPKEAKETQYIEGVRVYGDVASISSQDIAEIIKVIEKIKNVDPILSIEVLSNTRVDVETGVIRGPLDGSGMYYEVRKKDGAWLRHKTTLIRMWMSHSKNGLIHGDENQSCGQLSSCLTS